MSVDLTGLGTAESEWQAWPGLADLPALELPTPESAALELPTLEPAALEPADEAPDRLVLVAPHPDDEVLGAGGTAALLAAAGVPVVVVGVTGGEGSHPGSPTVTPDELVRRRSRERAGALARLGIECRTVDCALPDGGVAPHWRRLAATLDALVTERSWLLAPWSRDGHPDHDAAGRAAVATAARTGAHRLSYLVWTWHWAHPGDPRVPWDHALRVDLPDSVCRAKLAAAAEFSTQVRPLSGHPADRAVLPAPVLRRLTRCFEVFLR